MGSCGNKKNSVRMGFPLPLELFRNQCCPERDVRNGTSEKNLKIAEEGQPDSLSIEEKNLISEVSEIYRSRIKVNCTGCKYCIPCPMGVNIPRNLSYLNDIFMLDDVENAKFQYGVLLSPEEKAGNCAGCG